MGFFKIIHLEGSPLTRIDGMMIPVCLAAALPQRCGPTMSNCAATQPYPHYAGHHWRYYRWFCARLAMGCNLAAFFTGIPQFCCMPGSLPSPLPLVHGLAHAYPAAHLPYSRENAESFCRLTLTQKPDQARRRFRLGMLVFSVCWAGRCSRR